MTTRTSKPGTLAGVPDAATAPPATAITFEAAVLDYGSGVRAVDGLDLTVRRGESVALLGRNGAGKSTISGCCSGF